MPRVPLPLIGPAYKSRDLPLSAQVNKNLYPQFDAEGKVSSSLHTFPGLKSWSTGMTGPFRGDHVMNGVYYVVNANTLYSVDSAGTETSRGTISGSGMCGFADDGDVLMVVTGGDWYSYTASTTTLSSANPDPDLVNPTTVGYINSQFLFDNNSSTSAKGEFVSSAVGDGTDISALDFATAEVHPDDLTRIHIMDQLVYMMGSDSFETWFNSGVGRPPFDRTQGGTKPIGIAGRDAITEQEVAYFLDDERRPRKLAGFDTLPIGTNPLGKEFESYSDVSDCRVFSMNLDDQDFVFYTFPKADRTWGYHVPSNTWFQKSEGVDNARWRGTSYQRVYDKHIVADHSNGNVYELDFDTYTDNSAAIIRQRTTANITSSLYEATGAEMWFNRVEFVCDVGEGITSGQGSDPQIMIRYSDDGGYTFSASQQYPLGKGGDYLRRVVLTQQGRAMQRVYELTYSEPTDFTLYSAWADIDFGEG